jgi:broad specificity phosphatase PhoE
MEAPAITRYRRPFFAPLWLSLLAAVVVLGAIGLVLYRGAGSTVVLLVRPAEKGPGTIADPPLSPEGEARAQRLARMFGDAAPVGALDAIYVSDDRRAQQTAAPLAERLHRAPVAFAAADVGALAGRLLHEHAGGAVLVIASGASFGQLLHALGEADLPGGDADLPAGHEDADVMYLVSVPGFGRVRLVRLRL